MAGSLSERRILVTGGSRGIGRAVAERLAVEGAEVIVVSRRRASVDRAVAGLGGAPHSGIALDVADPAAWLEALPVLDEGAPLRGVVTAAGVLGPIGPIDTVDPLEFRRTLSVNLEGTALALRHSIPRIAVIGGAAVTFSGGGGGPLPRYDAYAASKAAVVRLTENLAADAVSRGVTVNAVAPGFVATEMHERTLAAGPEAAGTEYFEKTRASLDEGGVSAEAAADLVALGPEARAITGKLLSAQWDPWRDEAFRRRLAAEPDLATLRRIDDQAFFAAG